jgi:hypothetical protein
MRNYLYLILACLAISSCSKKGQVLPAVTQKVIVKDAGIIPYKIIPLADNQLKIAFINNQPKALAKVVLQQGTTAIATVSLATDVGTSVSAVFNYAFEPGKTYSFLVQSAAVSDTVYQYQIQGYQHSYIKAYNYQQVLVLHQSLGPDGFDISPSRNYLFIEDDISNTVQTKRLNLQTLAIDNVNYDLTGSPVRAVSDDELLAFGNKDTQNIPAMTDPGTDAVVLARYNMGTQKSVFVDFVSSGYGRMSRVINNHVLVTNPVFTAQTASLINLADMSSIKYPLNAFNFTLIDEYSFNHILYNNMLINTANGTLSSPLNLGQNSALIDIDDATGYAFAGTSVGNAANQYQAGFNVFQNKLPVYQSDLAYGRSTQFPIIYNIKNDVVTFYQYFGYDTKLNIDGYYTLNLKTNEIKLIQADSNPHVISDYQLKNGTTFSVRSDGVYKLTPVN